MRGNERTVLRGPRVRLMPYLRAMVPTYHAWMQDDELLRLTCSERLSLEEELANQISWREDAHKVTFIVCALQECVGEKEADPTAGMCGDVNAFLSPMETDDEASLESNAALLQTDQPPLIAELEVMIADPSQRRGGLAKESLLLFLHWLLRHIPSIGVLMVKITDDNEPSRRLFESLGFTTHKHMAVFEQTELRTPVKAMLARCNKFWTEMQAEVHEL